MCGCMYDEKARKRCCFALHYTILTPRYYRSIDRLSFLCFQPTKKNKKKRPGRVARGGAPALYPAVLLLCQVAGARACQSFRTQTRMRALAIEKGRGPRSISNHQEPSRGDADNGAQLERTNAAWPYMDVCICVYEFEFE